MKFKYIIFIIMLIAIVSVYVILQERSIQINISDEETIGTSVSEGFPSPSFTGIPGWFIIYLGTPRDNDAVFATVLPNNDNEWADVSSSENLILTTPRGNFSAVYLGINLRNYPNSSQIILQTASPMVSDIAWLLREKETANPMFYPVLERSSRTPDQREWSVASATLIVNRTGSRSATVHLNHGAKSLKIVEIISNPDHDISMLGTVWPFQITDDFRIPHPIGAFQFIDEGPLVILIRSYGYESTSYIAYKITDNEVVELPERHRTFVR